jgi:hypothetical protein
LKIECRPLAIRGNLRHAQSKAQDENEAKAEAAAAEGQR